MQYQLQCYYLFGHIEALNLVPVAQYASGELRKTEDFQHLVDPSA